MYINDYKVRWYAGENSTGKKLNLHTLKNRRTVRQTESHIQNRKRKDFQEATAGPYHTQNLWKDSF